MAESANGWPIETAPPGEAALGSLVWRREGALSATAIMKCTFSMVHAAFCVPTTPRDIERSDRPWMARPGRSLEAASELKPSLGLTEVLLKGHAVAPQREPTPALAVRLAVWRGAPLLDKTLHVFGERSSPEAYPRSFSTMPLVYERALGGPGTDNPVGMTEVDGAPFVIDPVRPDASAGFGPRSPSWPGRAAGPERAAGVWSWAPTITKEALAAAPDDQRLTPLEGREWIVLDGIHPDLPRFATRLPAPRPLAWLCDDAGGRKEIPLSLEALSVDTDQLEISLVFRGDVALPHAELARFLIEGDYDLDDPDKEPVRAVAEPARVAVPHGSEGNLGQGLRLAELDKVQAPAVAASPPVTAPRAVPPPAIVPPPPVVAPPAIVAPQADAEAEAAADAEAEPMPPTEVAPPAPPPAAAPPPAPPPLPAAEPAEGGMRATVLARVAKGEALRDLALAGADLSKLDLKSANFAGANLVGTKLAGAKLTGAKLGAAKLQGADLTEADLSEADLSQADLSRANLERAKLDGAHLKDAALASAVGKQASFAGAHMSRAVLSQGKWENAAFVKADLTGADLSGAEIDGVKLDEANLTGARLVDAKGKGASLVRATLTDANLAGATLPAAVADDLEAARTIWDRGVLDGASFRGANLESAGFARVHLDAADFSKAKLTKASLMGVTGEKAKFDEATMESVDLRQTKLPDASFEGAKLGRANALKATLGGAKMTRADMTGSSFRSAKLRGADLREASLKDADLRDADLEQADLEGAVRDGAKLSGAILKGAKGGDG